MVTGYAFLRATRPDPSSAPKGRLARDDTKMSRADGSMLSFFELSACRVSGGCGYRLTAVISEQPIPREDQTCANCGAALSGPYCSSCGQRQVDLDRPFRELAGEIMESFLSFDARIFRTLWPLISRPGWLTVEFLSGRRVRYIHPFKLYFAFSVLLFLALALTGYMAVRVSSTGEQAVTGIQIDTSVAEPEDDDSPAADADEPSFLGSLFESVGELAANDPERLNRLFTDRLAKSIILLVPIFALLLRVLHRRSRYIAHLVFSLHLHSFAFLAILIGLGIDTTLRAAEGKGPGNALAVVVIAGYSFFALRRVYGQGRLLTALKMVALLIGYLVALMVTMALTLALTAVTLL